MKKINSRESILAIASGLLLFFFIYRIEILLKISFVVMLIGIFSDFLSEKIAWLWMKLGELMGMVVSKFILSALFFVFLTPIALIARLFKPNRMDSTKKPGKQSYYIERNYLYTGKDLEQVF